MISDGDSSSKYPLHFRSTANLTDLRKEQKLNFFGMNDLHAVGSTQVSVSQLKRIVQSIRL